MSLEVHEEYKNYKLLVFCFWHFDYYTQLPISETIRSPTSVEKNVSWVLEASASAEIFFLNVAVLGKVKDFLGVMAEANKRLELDTKVCV